MNLSGKTFTAFLKMLEIVSTGCDYLDIENNRIRQLGNNKRNIFEVDLSPLFEDQDETLNMVMHNVTQKLQLLDTMHKQQCDVRIVQEQDGYVIHDDQTYIRNPGIMKKYVTNSFLSDKEYNKRIGTDNRTEVIEGAELSKILMDRMASMSRALSSKKLNVVYEKDEVTLELKVSDSNSPTTVDLVKFGEVENSVEGTAKFNIEPIVVCQPPLYLDLDVRDDLEFAYMRAEFMLCTDPDVTFTLWNLSNLVRESDEDDFSGMV